MSDDDSSFPLKLFAAEPPLPDYLFELVVMLRMTRRQ